MTDQQEKHTEQSKRRKWPWFILLGIILLLATVRLSLKTDLVHSIVKNQLVGLANQQLTVRFDVQNLEGDLWNEAILEGVILKDENEDTLASIDSLRIGYNVLSYFKPVFEVPKVMVTEPFVKVRQREGTVNITSWLKQAEEDTSASEPFPLRVDVFTISNGRVDATIDALPQDSALVIDNLKLNSSFALLGDGYEAGISSLSFDILQTRLDQAISIESSLQAEKQTVTLEKLVIATGNSVFNSSGRMDARDSTSNVSFEAKPMAWKDIARYVSGYPVEQNLTLGLTLEGNSKNFRVGLNAEAKGVDNLQAGADFSWDSNISLTKARLSADYLNLQSFLGDSSLPEIHDLGFEANGDADFQEYQQTRLNGTLTSTKIEYLSYTLDKLETAFSLSNGNLSADVATGRSRQAMNIKADVYDLWSDKPGFKVTVNGKHVNPGYWLNDEQYNGSLAFKAVVDGQGFAPGNRPWNYRLDVQKGELVDQKFDGLKSSGTLGKSRITNETLFRFEDSEVAFNASVEDIENAPRFSYELSTQNFDLSELNNLETYKSSLSLNVRGEGSGSSLESLYLRSSILMDSSAVNGEYINRLAADITIEDTVATVQASELMSTIADGSFDARLNLIRWYDTHNELNLDLNIKDIQIFAPLADIEELSAEGQVSGRLSPVYDDALKFSGDVNLRNLVYNEMFDAQEASGQVEVLVTQKPEYVIDLELVSPTFAAVSLRDLSIQTRGKLDENNLDGNFNLTFSGPNESGVVHTGLYAFASDSSVITTENYELTSSLRTLVLQQPFSVILKDGSVRMDTMKLSSDDGAVLELAIPYADSVRQEGHLVGRNLNLAAIQNTILSESYFEGILSGNLSVANSDSALNASGKLIFSNINYMGTSLDTLDIELDIEGTQFNSNLNAKQQGELLVSGAINVPFRLGDPETFDESFFDKPVSGHLRINEVALSRFDTLLSRFGIIDTEGIFQFDADLKGTAGEPQFIGDMKLDNALISGVKVDSMTAGLQYAHESSLLSLNATLHSLKQRAAEIKTEIPFFIDLKSGEVSLPGRQDSIAVDIETKDFNLAAFNDFVNREQLRSIKGRVNGMVHVTGPIDDLETNGELNFSQGSVRIMKTGITLNDMRATLFFEPDQLTIKDFRAKSGNGSLNLNGSIGFAELTPGNIDLTLRANNFRVANTSEYNAAINLNTKVEGSVTQPDISGSLSVLNGFVQLDNFGEQSVESVQLDSTLEAESSVAIYDSLSLDMDISFDRRFFIRNQRYLEMQAELDGSVDMLKDPGKDLQMFGSLETVSGYARPLGKRFELEEGIVTFAGEPDNPTLNIRTLFEPQQPDEEIKIWYIIEGNVEEPQFKYESSPPMELDDILCYTLFGQPCFALESWKRAVASSGSNSSATDLALEVFMDRIESLATQRLGIDVVKIDNTRIGGETGTSITTGWYINPRVFFAIQNVITGSTPDTGFLLEYLLQKNLKLIISQGNDSRQGIDLKWNYDY